VLTGSVQPDQMSLLGGAELGWLAPQSASCLGDWTVPGFMDTGLGGEFVNAPIA